MARFRYNVYIKSGFICALIRSACQRTGKCGKQIERCLISTFQIAESMGFKGDFRQWEELLRIAELTPVAWAIRN